MINKIEKNSFLKTDWSGGSTSEIYIHPHGSNFESGNYQVRISLAQVNLNESTFSPLPDVERTLTVLEGEHYLQVNNRGFVPVKPYTPVSFYGGDKTESKGKALNFNFMKKTKKPHEVNIMQAGSSEKLVMIPKFERTLLFIIEGSAQSVYGKLEKHDALVFDEEVFIDLEANCLFAKVDF